MTAVAAKCTHCLYELDFRHVEYDLNKQGILDSHLSDRLGDLIFMSRGG